MAILTCEPIADGTWQEFDDNGPYSALHSGAAEANNAADVPGTLNARLSVFTDIPPYVSVSNFQAVVRTRKTAADINITLGTTTSGVIRDSGAKVVNTFVWGTWTEDWPAPGLAFMARGLTEVFVRNDSGTDLGVARLYGVITYEPVATGFSFMLGLAGLMALQLAGPMDQQQFLKYVRAWEAAHPRHKFEQTDRLRAWDDYRAYRFPRHFLLGKDRGRA